MLSVIIDELTWFLIDDGYKRYPREIHKPVIPLYSIQFFVKGKDVIILEIPEAPNSYIIVYEYINLDDFVIDDIKILWRCDINDTKRTCNPYDGKDKREDK